MRRIVDRYNDIYHRDLRNNPIRGIFTRPRSIHMLRYFPSAPSDSQVLYANSEGLVVE